MNDEEARTIAEPIYKLAEAVEKLASAIEGLQGSISEDEPLNWSVARGLGKISNALGGEE